MSKKLIVLGAAVVLAFGVVYVSAGNGSSCSDDAKSASASCTKSASAAKVASSSCCATKSASLASCSAGRAAVAGYSKSGKAKMDREAHAAAMAKIVDEVPYREPKRLYVSGSMECGSCSYEATAGCAPLLKTADGKVYPLVPGKMVKAMKDSKAPNGYKLTTNVKKIDGVKYLDVKGFTAL